MDEAAGSELPHATPTDPAHPREVLGSSGTQALRMNMVASKFLVGLKERG